MRAKKVYIATANLTGGIALGNEQIRKYGGLFGIVAVAVYVLGSILATTYYPTPFSPITDWTSDLGNYDTNPGAP